MTGPLCGARKPYTPGQGERCSLLPHAAWMPHSWVPWSIAILQQGRNRAHDEQIAREYAHQLSTNGTSPRGPQQQSAQNGPICGLGWTAAEGAWHFCGRPSGHEQPACECRCGKSRIGRPG